MEMGVLGRMHDTKAGLHGDKITLSLMLDRKWWVDLVPVSVFCVPLLAIHIQTGFAMVAHMWLEILLRKRELQEAPRLSTAIPLVQ